MHNLARQLVATGCIFASAFIAGATPPRLFSTAEAAGMNGPSEAAVEVACKDGGCETPLAMADKLCDTKADGVVQSSEACKLPTAPLVTPEPEDYNYEPAWMSGLRKLDIPFNSYPRIEKYVHYWTASNEGRRIFRTWLRRSGKYRAEVDKALGSRKLPMDLAALVFVESGFSPTAKSKAGAVGLWQLMPATAKEFGLIVEKDYDERRSVAKSSEAAVDHLASLYGKLGAWENVLAAYDLGARALYKKQQAFEASDFWNLSQIEGALPKETVRYVPQILAFALVLKNLDRFGYDTLKLEMPVVTSDLDVPAGVPLALVAQASGTSVAKLRELNPEFLRDYVPDAATVVHIPAGGLARARVMLPHLLFDMESSPDQAGQPEFDWGKENGADSTAPGLRNGKDAKGGSRKKAKLVEGTEEGAKK